MTAPTTLGPVNLNVSFAPNAGQTAVITSFPRYDTCSNQTLFPGGSCFILASIMPQTPASRMSVSASVFAGGQVTTASTSSIVNINNPNLHTVHFIN